jgi:hypothetical protein
MENVSQDPAWLQSAISSPIFTVLSLTYLPDSLSLFAESYQIRTKFVPSGSLRIHNMITLHVASTISLLYLFLQLPLALSLRKERAKSTYTSFKTIDQIALANQAICIFAFLFVALDLVITFTLFAIAASSTVLLLVSIFRKYGQN